MRLFRLVISIASVGALLALVGTASGQDTTTTPTTPPAPVAVQGTLVGGVDISGMDQPTALAAVTAAFAQPIVIRVADRSFGVTNAKLGATYAIDAAVAEAMARTGAGNTPVDVEVKQRLFDDVVKRIIRFTDTKGADPKWVIARKPRITTPKPGKTPSETVIRSQITKALSLPSLRLEQPVIPLKEVGAKATLKQLGYVVTVSKGERLLRLWAPSKRGKAIIAKVYRVAVGAPSFPTPSGRFTLVNKQMNPWWYPPSSDWAKGEEPVPPGPSNPLGTRWMGLDRQDIGIHGTPDSGSIGGYASHGCIRMLIPSAEDLYSRIDVGTPVLIY